MVAGWVLLVVPVLIFALAMMVYALPRVAATAWASLGRQWAVLEDNLATGGPVGIPLRILSILAIALPVLASVYLLVRLVRSVARGVWRSTEGKPVRRGTAALAALAILAALAFAWWPRPDTYVPIQPTDSGTVLDALPWVFPFNRPGAPLPGDNQALAVNTTDGTTLYDVAFALAWADGSSVPNKNEAYALASCRTARRWSSDSRSS